MIPVPALHDVLLIVAAKREAQDLIGRPWGPDEIGREVLRLALARGIRLRDTSRLARLAWAAAVGRVAHADVSKLERV